MQWFKKIFLIDSIGISLWTVKRTALASVLFFIWNLATLLLNILNLLFMSSTVWDEDFFLSFINYTIKVSGPAWFSKICGFQISSALVQEGNCFQAVLFKESCFHFIFYLMLLCHLGPVHEDSNYLIGSSQCHFSLLFSYLIGTC